MLPDTGERYLTTPLFESIAEEMTDEEIEISRSTPNQRFDVCAASSPPDPSREQPVTAEAEAFVAEVVGDTDQPVVIFALEWCEFCWSVRKLFAACDIPYRSVDLDSVEYQENHRGDKIRAALQARVSARTVPQIFVGGQHVGGCTEVLDAYKDGSLQSLLASKGVAYKQGLDIDPYKFFPAWLHPR